MTRHSALQTIRDEHASLAAMLQSMRLMVQKGPGDNRRQFFDVLRGMLFYIDEFPERLHHPKESNLLFPKVVKLAPKVMGAVDKLERDHMRSEKAARDLQHLLLAWDLLGPSRRTEFEEAIGQYIDAYLEHMNVEEKVILSEAERMAGIVALLVMALVAMAGAAWQARRPSSLSPQLQPAGL